jgi:DNA-binding NarL/FixJ family response regulator
VAENDFPAAGEVGEQFVLPGAVSPKGQSMLRIVIATARAEALQAFAEALSSDPEVQLRQAVSGKAALEAIVACYPHLVIIDSALPDMTPLALVQKLLMVNASVNTAVVSSLADEEFHEASEGLGVLCRLPQEPGRGEAPELLLKLRLVLGGSEDFPEGLGKL